MSTSFGQTTWPQALAVSTSKPTLVAQMSYFPWVRKESLLFYYCQHGLCLQANGKSLCAVGRRVAYARTKQPFLTVQSLQGGHLSAGRAGIATKKRYAFGFLRQG